MVFVAVLIQIQNNREIIVTIHCYNTMTLFYRFYSWEAGTHVDVVFIEQSILKRNDFLA